MYISGPCFRAFFLFWSYNTHRLHTLGGSTIVASVYADALPASISLHVPVSLPTGGSRVIVCSNLASPKRMMTPSRYVRSLQSGPNARWLVCNIMAGRRTNAHKGKRTAGRQPERRPRRLRSRPQDKSPHRTSQAAWFTTDLAVGCP